DGVGGGHNRLPGNAMPRGHQDPLGCAECLGADEPVPGGHADVSQRNLRVLYAAQSRLARYELSVKSRCALLDDIPADVSVVATRPDDHVVSERRVAHPPFVAVESLTITFPPPRPLH